MERERLYGAEDRLEEACRVLGTVVPGEDRILGIIGGRYSAKGIVCDAMRRRFRFDTFLEFKDDLSGEGDIRKTVNILNDRIREAAKGGSVIYLSTIPAEIGYTVDCDCIMGPDEILRYLDDEFGIDCTQDALPTDSDIRLIGTPMFIRNRVDWYRSHSVISNRRFLEEWNREAAASIAGEDETFIKELLEKMIKRNDVALLMVLFSSLTLSKDFIRRFGVLEVMDSLVMQGLLVRDGNGYYMTSDVSSIILTYLENGSYAQTYRREMIKMIRQAVVRISKSEHRWEYTYDRYALASAYATFPDLYSDITSPFEEKSLKKAREVVERKMAMYPPMEGRRLQEEDPEGDILRLAAFADTKGPYRVLSVSEEYVDGKGSRPFDEVLDDLSLERPGDMKDLIERVRTFQEITDWWGRLKGKYKNDRGVADIVLRTGEETDYESVSADIGKLDGSPSGPHRSSRYALLNVPSNPDAEVTAVGCQLASRYVLRFAARRGRCICTTGAKPVILMGVNRSADAVRLITDLVEAMATEDCGKAAEGFIALHGSGAKDFVVRKGPSAETAVVSELYNRGPEGVSEVLDHILSELRYWQIMLDDGKEASQYVSNLLTVCECRKCLTERTEFFIDFLVPMVINADTVTRANLEYYTGRLELLYEDYASARVHFAASIEGYGKAPMSMRANKARCRYMQCCHKLGLRDEVAACVKDLNIYMEKLDSLDPDGNKFVYIREYIRRSLTLIR